MALQADELARQEEIASAARAKTHAMPSYQRQEQFPNAPLVRSTQAGGSNTRQRAGTEDEARAAAIIKGKGRGRSTGKGKGRGNGNLACLISSICLGAAGDRTHQGLIMTSFYNSYPQIYAHDLVDLEFLN